MSTFSDFGNELGADPLQTDALPEGQPTAFELAPGITVTRMSRAQGASRYKIAPDVNGKTFVAYSSSDLPQSSWPPKEVAKIQILSTAPFIKTSPITLHRQLQCQSIICFPRDERKDFSHLADRTDCPQLLKSTLVFLATTELPEQESTSGTSFLVVDRGGFLSGNYPELLPTKATNKIQAPSQITVWSSAIATYIDECRSAPWATVEATNDGHRILSPGSHDGADDVLQGFTVMNLPGTDASGAETYGGLCTYESDGSWVSGRASLIVYTPFRGSTEAA